MASDQRWQDAQNVEKSHQYHSDIRSEEAAKSFVENLNIEYEELKGKNIIAVGSGSGRIHNMSAGNKRVGIDPLTNDIFDKNTQSDAELLTGVGEQMPIYTDTFDIALSVNVLDHCKDPKQVLSEINRILTPNGKLLFNINTFGTPKFINKYLGIVDPPHPHHFTQQQIRQMIIDSGFEIDYLNVRKPNLDQANIKLAMATKGLKMRKLNLVAIAE